MQIHLTFDYELFFGSNSGTATNCLLMPTQQLINIATKHKVPLIFFVDAGYLLQLKNNSNNINCKNDYEKICNQLKQLITLGHEIGLHIHPHWEDSIYKDDTWQINTTRYKLASFSDIEIEEIVTKYHHAIIEITQKSCKSYRAGGWCIQPFNAIKKALQKNNIFIDSTVYYNGLHLSPAHSYNFTTAKKLDSWHFENDPCIEVKDGSFFEMPTTPDVIWPFFYWNLYFKMKTNAAKYKPVGDGNWLVDKKRIYKHFYKRTNHFACADGFFASRLMLNLNHAKKQNFSYFTVLSHPKSLAPYSFLELEKFIICSKKQGHTFSTISIHD